MVIYSLMELMMYIGNDLIESIKLDEKRLSKPGYLGTFKRCLKQKYRELILQYPNPPEFLVIDPSRKVAGNSNQ
jgi:hypothetical protein